MDVAFAAKEMPRALFPRRFSPLSDASSLNIDEGGAEYGDPNGSRHLFISIAMVILLLGLFGAVSLFLEYTWTPECVEREVCLDRCERGMEDSREFLDQERRDQQGKDDESLHKNAINTQTFEDQRWLPEATRLQPQPKATTRITAPRH